MCLPRQPNNPSRASFLALCLSCRQAGFQVVAAAALAVLEGGLCLKAINAHHISEVGTECSCGLVVLHHTVVVEDLPAAVAEGRKRDTYIFHHTFGCVVVASNKATKSAPLPQATEERSAECDENA